MIVGIHHFSLIASSEEVVQFYKGLGFKEEQRLERGGDTVVLLRGNGVGLEIFIDPSHPTRSAPEPLGLRTLGLRVDKIEGPEEIQMDWNGNRYVVLSDPDGNVVQLCEA